MFVAFISCSFPFVVRADYGVGCPTVTRQVSQSLGQYVPRQSPTFCLLLDSVRYNREQGDRALVDHLVCIAVREAASSGEIEDLVSSDKLGATTTGHIVADNEF